MGEKAHIEDILIANKTITAQQRDEATLYMAQNKCKFGEALVRLNFTNEETIALALSAKLGYPYASQKNKILAAEFGQNLDRLVPEAFAREHLAFPLFKEENILTVALADPEDIITLENLRVLSKCEILPFVASKTNILKAIDGFYHKGQGDLIARTLATARAEPEDADEGARTGEEASVNLDRMVNAGSGSNAANVINAILKQAVSERCSDIHLETFEGDVMLRFRIDGTLYARTAPPPQIFLALISRLKILGRLDIAEKRLPQDGMFSMNIQNRQIDVRISVCPADYGEKIVLRILDKEAVELNIGKIGLEPRQREDFLGASREPHGLIFLTGPTGSGKTTTLYSLLNTIKTVQLNFMSIEDPIEIKLRGVTQVQVKTAIGLTFASALRSFLRQDPDVILVGEVRDSETAQTCMRAALTGHLVFSTLHTNDAMSTVARLIDLGAEPYLLSSALSLVAAQRLVRLLCPACKKPAQPDPETMKLCLSQAQLPANVDMSKLGFYEPQGCPACSNTGYRGRVGVYEVYRITQEIRDIIYKDKADMTRLKAAAARAGMWNLRASAWRKALMGFTTPDEVFCNTQSNEV